MSNYPYPFYGQPYAAVANDGRNLTTPKASLTEEEIKLLRTNDKEFDFHVSETALMRSHCNHIGPGGVSTLVPVDEANSIYRCSLCGTTFKFLSDISEDMVEKAVETMNNITNTLRTLWKTAPEVVDREFFQYQPVLERLIPLTRVVLKSFNDYENAMMGVATPNVYSPNFSTYQMEQQMLRSPVWQYNNYGQAQAPQAAAPAGWNPSMGYGQPAPQYMYQNPGANPMAVGVPNGMPAGAPQYNPPMAPEPAPGFVQNPYGAPQAQAAPQAPGMNVPPVQQTTTQTVGDVNVQQTKSYES